MKGTTLIEAFHERDVADNFKRENKLYQEFQELILVGLKYKVSCSAVCDCVCLHSSSQ